MLHFGNGIFTEQTASNCINVHHRRERNRRSIKLTTWQLQVAFKIGQQGGSMADVARALGVSIEYFRSQGKRASRMLNRAEYGRSEEA